MFERIKSLLSRVSTGAAVSIGAHAVLFGALFLVTGIVENRGDERQIALLRAEPVAPVTETDPEIEPDVEPTTPPNTPIPEPMPSETAPEDPPAFDEEFVIPLEADVLPPLRLAPTTRPKPPAIAVAPRAPATAALPPKPAARPAAKPARPQARKKTHAIPRSRPAPNYPDAAVRRELEGRVLLLVEVLPTGGVGEIKVSKSSGHGILDRAAIEAVRGWSFRPARTQDRPVRSWVEIPINFRLTN